MTAAVSTADGPATGASRPGDRARATVFIVLSACCFGSISILTILATRTGASLLTVITGRYAFAAIALALTPFLRRGISLRIPASRAARIAFGAGAVQAAIAFVTLRSLDYISAATLVFLFYTYPAWVAIIAAVRGTERIDRSRAIALALALGGIVLMVGGPGSVAVHPLGAALALAGAILYGAYIPFIGALQLGLPPLAVSMWISVGVAIIIGSAGLALGDLSVRLAPVAWGSILTLAIVSTALAFHLFLSGLAVLGSVRTAIVSTIEPFWTSLLGAVVLSQALSGTTLLGGMLIAAAVILLQRAAPSGRDPRSDGRRAG